MGDLEDERGRLEGEIERLRGQLDVTSARLEVARVEGPRPRGFFPGLLVGIVLTLVAFAGLAWLAFVAIMSHD
jgi:hypothetical protein